MSLLLPVLSRFVVAGAHTADVQQLLRLQATFRCTNQARLWAAGCNDLQNLFQVQQLHTSAAAAAAVPSQQQQASPQQGSTSSSSIPAAAVESSSQLQPVDSTELISTLICEQSSHQLGPQHIGLYYEFNKALVPEAFQPFHQAFYSPRPAKLQRKGGCRGLQAELALTNSSSLMWRRSSQELAQVLGTGSVPRVYLQGPPGAGKSISLVQMVEWARNNGWLVMYIPSAAELTRGGFFYKRSESDSYDTIISAQHILKAMADSHTQQLSELPLQLRTSQQLLQSPAASAALSSSSSAAGSGGKAAKGTKGSKAAAPRSSEGSLMQLVTAGLSTDDDGKLAVECCLALVNELAAVSQQQPVLLAVDDYNALYWKTDYGRTVYVTPPTGPAYQYRKDVKVEQLNLARGFRLLERQDLQACRVLVADNSSGHLPEDIKVPCKSASTYHLPRFSEVETAHALYYYHERGLTAAPPSQQQVSAMRALTNGSGTDLRRWCLKVTMTDMGLL